jgi:hypothetical protein
MNRRKAWVQDLPLGAEAAETTSLEYHKKKAMENFTGKDWFGDVSKKLFGDLFGGKKKVKRG